MLAAVAVNSSVDASLEISTPYAAIPNDAAATWLRVNASCAGVYRIQRISPISNVTAGGWNSGHSHTAKTAQQLKHHAAILSCGCKSQIYISASTIRPHRDTGSNFRLRPLFNKVVC